LVRARHVESAIQKGEAIGPDREIVWLKDILSSPQFHTVQTHLPLALGERFAARGIPLVADPSRSPFRIYRDTRFSNDKSPYKTNVSAS
jgi:uncharacterized protein (DUF2461 family)